MSSPSGCRLRFYQDVIQELKAHVKNELLKPVVEISVKNPLNPTPILIVTKFTLSNFTCDQH